MDEIIVKKRFIEDMLTFKILTEVICMIKVKSVLPKCIVFNCNLRYLANFEMSLYVKQRDSRTL